MTLLKTPSGYHLHHRANLATNEGWTLQATGSANADANHRPENVTFGRDGMSVILDRDEHGLWSGEARGYHAPFPNFHRTAAAVRLDAPMAGGWPGLWKVPAPGGPRYGEIDDLERFGLHDTKGTLHTTPYDASHRFVSTPNFPTMAAHVPHLVETELTPTYFRWGINGREVARMTPASYNKATGTDSWAAMFGDPAKQWIWRVTMQGGSAGAGRVPATFTGPFKFTINELAVYIP
jgi:hypothetical protein